MIKAYINTPYKKIGIFSVFEKIIKRKGKKNPNISVSRTTLCTQKNYFCMQKSFLENVCLRTKKRFAVEKKSKKNFEAIFCVAIKKMLVVQFPYMGIV